MTADRRHVSGPITLVRHASTAWSGRRWLGRRDLPLTERGLAEAEALAERLAAIAPSGTIVVASPARRALETAGPIARRLGGPVVIDPDLREVDVGRTEGLTWEEVERDFPAFAAALVGGIRVDWPGGETADEVDLRTRAAWSRLAGRATPTIAVTHGGIIAGILAELGLFAPQPLGPGQRARWIAPARAILLRREPTGWAAHEP